MYNVHSKHRETSLLIGFINLGVYKGFPYAYTIKLSINKPFCPHCGVWGLVIKKEGEDMKTSVGFWDALFGERVALEIPSPNGSVKKVEVTKKWMEKMEREGKMKQVSSSKVKVNILDPMGGVTFNQFDDPAEFMAALGEPKDEHRIEYWTIGEQVPQKQYKEYLDLKTKELYAITKYNEGKPSTFLTQRTLWEQARDAMRNV